MCVCVCVCVTQGLFADNRLFLVLFVFEGMVQLALKKYHLGIRSSGEFRPKSLVLSTFNLDVLHTVKQQVNKPFLPVSLSLLYRKR